MKSLPPGGGGGPLMFMFGGGGGPRQPGGGGPRFPVTENGIQGHTATKYNSMYTQ